MTYRTRRPDLKSNATRARAAWLAWLAGAALVPAAGAGTAPVQGASTRSIADLSIEELLNVEVVTANRKPQRLSDTAAAVFVLTHDDIHRSGATNVPELLRGVPGVNVAWIGGDAYSVTIRGFAGRFAKQLLVLRDGRSLYTGLFAGVFWERELPLLEDIERIEVIRGPGAAVWGANAVNGVINIITRSASETRDTLVGAGFGSEGRRGVFARGGVDIGPDTALRIYGRAEQAQPGAVPAAAGTDGMLRSAAGGLRLDRERGESRLSLQAEAHSARSGQPTQEPLPTPPYVLQVASEQRMTGGFLLARYETPLAGDHVLSMQANLSHERVQFPSIIDERRDVLTLEAQDHFRPFAGHEAMLGLSAVSDADDITATRFLVFTPTSQTRATYRLLAQDEVALWSEWAHLTVGTIVENDSYAGTHAMPDLRLAVATSPTSTLWLSVSRALRSPARVERSVHYLVGPTVPAQPPQQPLAIIPTAIGTAGFRPESELGWQAGFRSQLSHDLSIDLAAYLSKYTDLRTAEVDSSAIRLAQLDGVPYLELPLPIVNGQSATARGVELALDWRAREWWRLSAGVSTVSVKVDSGTDYEEITTNAPRVSATLRSMMDLGRVHVDLSARYVDGISVFTFQRVEVPAYTAFDARIGWSVARNLEVALVGRNLTDPSHLEFASDHLFSPLVPAGRSLNATVEFSY